MILTTFNIISILKKKKTINFQGYVLVAPIYGDAIILGYRLSATISLNSLDLENNEFIFQPIFSPKTHALASIESVEREGEEERVNKISGIKSTPEIKKVIINLLKGLQSKEEKFDTILAFRGMSWCGIKGFESIARFTFKGIFSSEREKSRNVESRNDLFKINGFNPVQIFKF